MGHEEAQISVLSGAKFLAVTPQKEAASLRRSARAVTAQDALGFVGGDSAAAERRGLQSEEVRVLLQKKIYSIRR